MFLVVGLMVNLIKSMVAGVGCSEEVMYSLVNSLSCKVRRLPIQFLGLPTRNSRLKAHSGPVIKSSR